MRGLYAIVDLQTLESRGLDPLAFAEAVLAAHPAALQLRAKGSSAERIFELLTALAPLCERAGVPLVANDHPELARRAGCAMVHVGQTDMPIEEVRRVAAGIGVGVSTHDLVELERVLFARPTYAAFGPIFPTASKAHPSPVVGTKLLRLAYDRAHEAGVPLVAIGGITRERARSLAGLADAVAVIGDLVPSRGPAERSPRDTFDEVVARARALQAAFALTPAS
jgi:thiamine-phosphate pyrophosphorylase